MLLIYCQRVVHSNPLIIRIIELVNIYLRTQGYRNNTQKLTIIKVSLKIVHLEAQIKIIQ